ncbi:hypothetical protein DY000_02059993 [Brassica cretica]|uniref:thioglucosidase n=1 Tax=Brassica cretica TaxID=69181 RepID=A0ABQ7AQL7_BRACR|nr:hypothetical protein DY000_02059993 [Brassica cretica]
MMSKTPYIIHHGQSGGLYLVLNYIKNIYGNPLTYITENVADLDTGNLTLPDALADNGRIQNHCSHFSCLKCSINDGFSVAGYFAWSLMDNYEFGNGYTSVWFLSPNGGGLPETGSSRLSFFGVGVSGSWLWIGRGA